MAYLSTRQQQLKPVRLGQIAEVEEVPGKVGGMTRVNGREAVILDIQKQSGANTVAVSREIEREAAKLEQEYAGLEFIVTVSQARHINKSTELVMRNALIGGLLAVLVLLSFLRSLRSTLVIAVSIPVSIIATFNLMYFTNLTLNLMTLSGLALGIGMLVDSSIVVLENIHRHLEAGSTPRSCRGRRL